MRKIDLHIHTNISDGSETPEGAVRYAKEHGICAIAITDHDTVNGVKRAQAEGEKCGVEVVAGTSGDMVGQLAESASNSVFLNYGNFIQQTIDFLIIALCIFLVLRALTVRERRRKAAEAAAAAEKAAEPAPKSEDVVLLEEIRDLLKNQK